MTELKNLRDHRFLGKFSLHKGTPPNQYILYNHVTDFYLRGVLFADMRKTLTEYLHETGYRVIAFYSLSEGLRFADELKLMEGLGKEKPMRTRFKELTTEPVTSTYGGRQREQAESPDQQRQTAQRTEMNPQAAFASLTRLLVQDSERASVVIERIQNLISNPPAPEERPLVDNIQSWSGIANQNVSILIADCEDVSDLASDIVGKNRSGVEIISVGLPNQDEIKNLFFNAQLDAENEGKTLKINEEQKTDIVNRLAGTDCIGILNYLKECYEKEIELNMRTLRQLMTKTEDRWSKALDRDKIKQIERELKERVKGQDYAISRIIGSLHLVKQNLEEQKNTGKANENPLAYFFFAGPTGVGKTEIFRVLAEKLTSIRYLKVNMPEYAEEHAINRFFGAPPGYVGHGKGELGQFLTDNPSSIILFDEFEKAHEKIFKNFLTMLEGGLTAGDGTRIDMSQTILFFTSNAGASELKPIEPGMTEGQHENIRRENVEVIKKALKESKAPPELIGRMVESITPFNHLSREVAEEVININLEKIKGKLSLKNREIKFHESIKWYLLDYYERNKALGARPLVSHIDGKIRGDMQRLLEKASGSSPDIVYVDKDGLIGVSSGEEGLEFYKGGKVVLEKREPIRIEPEKHEGFKPGKEKEFIKREAINEIGRVATVIVFSYKGREKEEYCSGIGTGVLVSPEGHVLTNRHVIAGATRLSVCLSGGDEELDMVLETVDHQHDLALLKLSKPYQRDFPFVTFGRSWDVEAGDEIVVLGYPHFQDQRRLSSSDFIPSVVEGIISLCRREEGIFQLNCSINPGNSGGPVISLENGDIIGIAYASRRKAEGYSYAISSQVAISFLKETGIITV